MTYAPLSEIESKFHAEWTAADCIAEMRRLAEAEPDRFWTRMAFRNESRISDATWNRYFGTWDEFKRQAGITLSRHAHRIEKQVAQHASRDKMRATGAERQGWGGTYARPSGARFQTALIYTDVHDIMCDPFYRRTLIDTARRVQPEKLICGGDLFDLPSFSKHTQDPRSYDVIHRIRWVHQFLRELRAAAPNAEMTLIEGNHEARMLRHLAEETPAMMVVLEALHGMTVPRLLGLDEFEMNYVARCDLAAWTVRDQAAELRKNYRVFWECLLVGHYPQMRSMGLAGACGHHHKHELWTHYSPLTGPVEFHQLGGGHRREASYCAGEKWSNGFILANVDTHNRRVAFDYADVTHEHAMIGGQFYQREANETVALGAF